MVDYFVQYEVINMFKRGISMIVLNLELDNIYSFKDFKVNFSYPKRVIKSTIEGEYLKERPNFRYRKAVILMGSNGSGKTTLGRALLRIFRFIELGDFSYIREMIGDPSKPASFSIDFVNGDNVLNRLVFESRKEDEKSLFPVFIFSIMQATIGINDTYEKAVDKLKLIDFESNMMIPDLFRNVFGEIECSFALLDESNKEHNTSDINQELFLSVLKAVIGTLDPTLTDISVLEGVEDSYVIRRNGQEIILQKGKLLGGEFLSSGTLKGIDIAILMAKIISSNNGFYYCDEHFSYVQTDLEKRLFGIMLEYLGDNEQLIFTTHNSDMMDLNLPKHTYAFLSKKKEDNEYIIRMKYASDVLKRNTDSVRSACENDVFSSIPDETLLDELEKIR